ncbi:hypothetical protein [Robertmurraya siralis]|nr:hypothetical protein [Robertmurraya siralis]
MDIHQPSNCKCFGCPDKLNRRTIEGRIVLQGLIEGAFLHENILMTD